MILNSNLFNIESDHTESNVIISQEDNDIVMPLSNDVKVDPGKFAIH